GLQFERLTSEADRAVGVFKYRPISEDAFASQTPEMLDYEERSMVLSINQLVSREWSLGARYKLSRAKLRSQLTQIAPAILPGAESENRATLQELSLFAIFNHSSGVFARAEATWLKQDNQGYEPDQPGDDIWQVNLLAGYR